MLKEKILQILNLNKEQIKDVFSVDDDGIDKIKMFLKKDCSSFKEILDDIFLSDMGNREKMLFSYLIGYANGMRKVQNEINK